MSRRSGRAGALPYQKYTPAPSGLARNPRRIIRQEVAPVDFLSAGWRLRVDLHQEIEPGDATLEIPWSDPVNPHRSYLDLKAQPELGELVEECRDHPALADFLRQVNSSRSPFRTAKCDVWATTELAEDERRDFDLPQKVGSYVDLLFDSAPSSSRLETQLELGAYLERRLAGLRVQAQLDICVRRCLFHPEERWGYYLTLFTHAYGTSREEAAREWARALAAQGQALEEITGACLGPGGPEFQS